MNGASLTLLTAGTLSAVALLRRGGRDLVSEERDLEALLRQTWPEGSRAATELKPTKARMPKLHEAAQRFLQMDADQVSDDLLVAVAILGAVKGDPVAKAREILGDVSGDLARVTRGMGLREAGVSDLGRARMSAISELSRRAMVRQPMGTALILSSADAANYLRRRAEGPYERFVALYLNTRNEVICMRTLTQGSARFTVVDPPQILRPAIEFDARSVILAHQHPSGDATPSSQDLEVTRRVVRAANALNIQILDHLILTPSFTTSMRDRGDADFAGEPFSSWTA